MNVSVEEVKRDPEGFLHRVIEGETLIVTDQDRPIAEIRPIEAVRPPRPFGLAAGSFVVPDDFDDLLPEDVLRDFEQLLRNRPRMIKEQVVILKLPERRASASERDARRTLKDLQWQRLWQVQRISRSFAVLRASRSLRSLNAPAGSG